MPVGKTGEMITRTLYSDAINVGRNYDLLERTSTCFHAVCATSMLSDSIHEIPTMLEE